MEVPRVKITGSMIVDASNQVIADCIKSCVGVTVKYYVGAGTLD